jgi:hypothetical protein
MDTTSPMNWISNVVRPKIKSVPAAGDAREPLDQVPGPASSSSTRTWKPTCGHPGSGYHMRMVATARLEVDVR